MSFLIFTNCNSKMYLKLKHKSLLSIFIFFSILAIVKPQNSKEKEFINRNFENGFQGIQNTVFKNPGRRILIIGGIGSAIAYQMDDSVQDWFLNNQPLPESINRFGDRCGNFYSGIFVLTASGILSYQSNSLQKFEYAFATLGTNGLVTVILKDIIGRERPNGSSHRSFPSGHTSHSFATATIFKELFGWKWGVPTYSLAIITAVNRLQDNKHYLSDVVFAAGLGTAFGLGFSKSHLGDMKKVVYEFNPVKSELRFSVYFY